MKILVVVANRLHHAFLGCYGNDWIGTPTFDRLAAEGIVFDRHYADHADSAGARHAWRTGRYHFPLPDGAAFAVPADTADLAGLLRGARVNLSFVSDRVPARASFDAGWENSKTVVEEEPFPALSATLDAVAGELDRLARRKNWLLWVELNTLLPPWTVPEDFFDAEPVGAAEPEDGDEEEIDADEEDDNVSNEAAPADSEEQEIEAPGDEEEAEVDAEEDSADLLPLPDPVVGPLGDDPGDVMHDRLQLTYAAAVRCVDAGLAQLRQDLEERGLLDKVILIVTSDRGSVLGEHGLVGDHRPWLHADVAHLPLLVRLPEGAEASRRISALTQPVDLLPTLLELFQVPIPASVHGHSLVPTLHGVEAEFRAYACSALRIGNAIDWSLRSPEWSFLLPAAQEPGDPPRRPQLYVQPDDRCEVNDVALHYLDMIEHFEQVIRAFVQAAQQPGALEPPSLHQLAAEPTE